MNLRLTLQIFDQKKPLFFYSRSYIKIIPRACQKSPYATVPLLNCRRIYGGFIRKWFAEAEFLGRNSDKSFPPCYSQSPLQLEIYFSSKSRNFLQFLEFSTVTVHCKGERRRKPDRKSYPLLYGLRNPYRNLKWTLKIIPRNLNKIARSWIRLQGKGSSSYLASMWQIHPAWNWRAGPKAG